MKKGFTIIELLTVVLIIAIMMGVLGVGISKSRLQARDATRMSHISLTSQVIEQYAASHGGRYPVVADTMNCVDTITNASELNLTAFANNAIPKDPKPAAARGSSCSGPVHGYYYATQVTNRTSSGALQYTLQVGLEQTPNEDATEFQKDSYSPPTNSAKRFYYFFAGAYSSKKTP